MIYLEPYFLLLLTLSEESLTLAIVAMTWRLGALFRKHSHGKHSKNE